MSPASNTIGPLVPQTSMVMDNLTNFSLTYAHSENLRISTETWPRLRQTEEDFFQAERATGSEAGELVYRADTLTWIDVVAFSDKVDSVGLLYSTDGSSWKPLPDGLLNKNHRMAYPSQISGKKDNPIDKYTYAVPALPHGTVAVKIVTGNARAANTYPWIARVHLGFNGSLKTAK